MTPRCAQHHFDRILERGAPARMNGKRPRARPGPQPGADHTAVLPQWRVCAAHRIGPIALREQRPVSDPHRGQVGDRAEVQGQPGAPRMIAPGGVDEQHIGSDVQRVHRRLSSAGGAPRQQPGARERCPRLHRLRDQPALL